MKKALFFVLLLTLVFASFMGCSKTVRYSPEEIKDYPPAVQEQIRQGNVVIGMTTQQVRYTWGPPSTVNVIAPTPDGKPREEWIYGSMGMGVFMERRLLFVDGKLVDIFPEPKPAPAPALAPEAQPKP
jgi:hypothetical protein